MRIRSVVAHSTQVIAEGALIASLAIGLTAGTVFAGHGGKGGSTSGGGISGYSMVTDLNGNQAANWDDVIHLNVTTSNAYPVASLSCTQNGNLVFSDSHPYYWPNVWDDNGNFTLASMAWSSGAASCTATLKGTSNGKTVTLATAVINVGA